MVEQDRDTFKRHRPNPEKERMGQLMRRTDLASAIGVVFRVPFHGQDESGNWRYGLPPVGGGKNPETAAEFEREMRQIVVDSAIAPH